MSPIVFVAGDSSITITFSFTGVLLLEVCLRGDRRNEEVPDGPGAVAEAVVVRLRFFFNIDGVNFRGFDAFRL